jgi:hypothetical protein
MAMTSDPETEAAELAQIEADLAELSGHVDRWITERFLAPDSAAEMNLVDVTGLITWLHQWHAHFDGYAGTASALAEEGRPAMADRLAQIRVEIDNSIASFTQIAASLPAPE